MPSPSRSRVPPLVLALILPLAAAGGAAAEPRAEPRTWTDPPAKAATVPEAPARAPGAPPQAKADPVKTDPVKADPAVPAPARTAGDGSVDRGGRATAMRHEAPPRRTPPRRLADTPAAGAMAAQPPAARPVAAAQPFAQPVATGQRVAAAQALAADYLAAVSGPDEAMVGAATRFYGAQVRFYGRPTTQAALIAAKRGFVRRWPERRYEARGFRTTCTADGTACTVRALVDFRAASPQRGAVSRGSSELVLEMRFSGARPVIVAETGRVLRRGTQAGTLAPAGGRA